MSRRSLASQTILYLYEWAGYDHYLKNSLRLTGSWKILPRNDPLKSWLFSYTLSLSICSWPLLVAGCVILLCKTPAVPFCSPFLAGPSHTSFAARLLQSHHFLPSLQRVDIPLVGRNIPYEAKWGKSSSPPAPQRSRAVSHWLEELLTESAGKMKGVISAPDKQQGTENGIQHCWSSPVNLLHQKNFS